MTPRQTGACSLWELSAALDGWVAAHSPPPRPEAPTDEEHEALMRKHA